MFNNELAPHSLKHGDVRYENLLMKPEYTDALPSIVSSRSNKEYSYRIIDFDCATRTNLIPMHVEQEHKAYVSAALVPSY